MTTEDVHEIIFKRMLQVYLPPLHLRNNREGQEIALRGYEHALFGFKPETLEKAWEKVTSSHEFWSWPHAATLAACCAEIEPVKRRSFEESPEATRQRQAREMAEKFTADYRKNAYLARMAKKAGWIAPLMEYVTASASLQAQLICSVENIGWNACVLTSQLGKFNSSEEAFHAFRATLSDHLDRGKIVVDVPKNRISAWKDEAVKRKAGPQASHRA